MLWMLSAAFAGFGGADVAVVDEVNREADDEIHNEVLVDIAVLPYTLERGALELRWVPSYVSWTVYPSADRLDRFEVAVIEGYRAFSSGTTSAAFRLGNVRYDQEDALVDLGIAQGGVRLGLADQRLEVRLGADARVRFVDTGVKELLDSEAEKEVALLLGLPVGVSYLQPLPSRLYARGGVDLRPSLGLLGTQGFAFDSTLAAEAGVHALAEDEAKMDIFLGYALRIDTYTALAPTVENRFAIGARGRF